MPISKPTRATPAPLPPVPSLVSVLQPRHGIALPAFLCALTVSCAIPLAASTASNSTAKSSNAISSSGKTDRELDIEAQIGQRFYDSAYELFDDVGDLLTQVERNIAKVAEASARDDEKTKWWVSWDRVADKASRVSGATVRVPNFFPKNDIAAIRDGTEKLKADCAQLAAANAEFDTYFDKNGNAADKNQKYIGQKPALLELIASIRETNTAFNARCRKFASDGEARMLPKNPIGTFIIEMRAIIATYGEARTLVLNPVFVARDPYEDRRKKRAPETDEEKNARMALAAEVATKLETCADTLADLAAKRTPLADRASDIEAEGTSVSDAYKRALVRFYDDVTPDVIKLLKETAADLRKKGVIESNDLHHLTNPVGTAQQLINSHNDFAETYDVRSGGDRALKIDGFKNVKNAEQ